jgi:hypothetical protein
MNHHRALASCLGMIFSENRFTLFRIMPYATAAEKRTPPDPCSGLLPPWRRDDKSHCKSPCGLAIGLEQPLRGLDVRSAALEPASHEKIDQRGKSQPRGCQ